MQSLQSMRLYFKEAIFQIIHRPFQRIHFCAYHAIIMSHDVKIINLMEVGTMREPMQKCETPTAHIIVQSSLATLAFYLLAASMMSSST